jgi:hypothetical protein
MKHIVKSVKVYSKVRKGKQLDDSFLTEDGMKQGDGLKQLFLNFASEYAITKVQENLMGHISYWLTLMM